MNGGAMRSGEATAKSQVRAGNLEAAGIRAAGEIPGGRNAQAGLPYAAAYPLPTEVTPGGSKKTAANKNGGNGPRGGMPPNLGGNGNRRGSPGGGKGRRRGRRGMPYKDIRTNLAGHTYHGAQGVPAGGNNTETKVRLKKKKSRVGIPGTKENKDYLSKVNA